jgi:DNA-directed RNA polymerase III subunit RPC2
MYTEEFCSCKCVLTNLSDEELVAKQECPYDAGGYFIIKGTEKVILMHEQLQQNRAIIELDNKGNVVANINSSTHDRKSRCSLFFKANKVYLKSSTLGDNIPVVIVLKAMGLECDQEIVQLIGSEPALMNLFAGTYSAWPSRTRLVE